MKKLIMETIKGATLVGGKTVLGVLAVTASSGLVEDIIDKVRYNRNVKYSDAVSVILKSGMFSTDKQKALVALKKEEGTEFYKAIIQVVKSNMCSRDKLETIINLSKEEA